MKHKIIIWILCMMGAIGAEAQIIGAETETVKPSKSRSTIDFKKKTGLQLRLQAGYPTLGGVTVGYQLNPYFMLGGGLGYGSKKYTYTYYRPSYRESSYSTRDARSRSNKKTELGAIPVFVEVEARTMAWSGFSFFVNVKAGLNIGFGNKESKITYECDDYYGDPVYSTEKYEYNLFLWSVTGGWSYKNFNWGIGYGSEGVATAISYDIPLSAKKKK